MTVEGPTPARRTDNPYDQFITETQRQHRLLSVHWELSYRCNQRCTHCYLDVFSPHASVPHELTTAECLGILDDLATMGTLNLTLSGGEIFVRRDLFEIAEYARRKRFLLRLFTNGVAVTPAIADRIAALHPFAVEISIYSTQAQVHEKITRLARSFDLTTRAFRLLHERGVRTVMKTPLMHENVHEFSALKALAEELGARFRYDLTITPKDSGDSSPLMHRLTDEDLLWVTRQDPDPEFWLQRPDEPDQPLCNIARNALVIDPYGNIFPCVQVRIKAGNVRTQSLESIWKESTIWKELSSLTAERLPVCGTCGLRPFCLRCHGLALLEEGDLRAPSPVRCRQAFLRRQVLIEQGALPMNDSVPSYTQITTIPAGQIA